MYFDLNDFDEALLAPATWELLRLVTSIYIAFDTLEISAKKAEKMAELYLRSYRQTLLNGKARCVEPRTSKGIVCDFLEAAAEVSYKDLLKKRTVSKKKRIMLSLKDERHFKLERRLKDELTAHLQTWVKESRDAPFNYDVKSVVFRLAGTGSIGVKRYLFLLKSTTAKNHYLLLDMKQCRPSSLSPYVPVRQLQWAHEAERVTAIQKRVQYTSASLLSSTVFRNDSYIIQELQPVKDTIKFKLLKNDYRNLYQVIDDMGMLTASSQLRSAGMQGSATIDELIAFAADERWAEEILAYARNYRCRVKEYYNQFLTIRDRLSAKPLPNFLTAV